MSVEGKNKLKVKKKRLQMTIPLTWTLSLIKNGFKIHGIPLLEVFHKNQDDHPKNLDDLDNS